MSGNDIESSEATAYFKIVKRALVTRGIAFEPGLSNEEVAEVEKLYSLCFPIDLRTFLQIELPVGDGFPNWRGSRNAVEGTLTWPEEGILYDVETSAFWLSSWGPRPSEMSEVLAVVRKVVANAPRLIPIFEHRYISSELEDSGNPVLSVYQTDIIAYGNDLPGYFHIEFGVPLPHWARAAPRPVRFWDELVLVNSQMF